MIPRLVIKGWQIGVDEHLTKFKTGKSYDSRIIVQTDMCPKAIIYKVIGNL